MRTITFEGPFTLFSGIRAFEAVRDAKEPVELDLRRVTSFQNAALQALADTMALAGPRRLVVRGLGQHQCRLLAHLGMNAADFEPSPMRPRAQAPFTPEAKQEMAA